MTNKNKKQRKPNMKTIEQKKYKKQISKILKRSNKCKNNLFKENNNNL